MPWFNIELEDELSTKFKTKIVQKYGKIRGNINKAFSEAVTGWVTKEDSA